jgi:hypothetical protein
MMKNADWQRLINRRHRRPPELSHLSRLRALYLVQRRSDILRRLDQYGGPGTRGVQARIARELEVHPSTVCREIRKAREPNGRVCPTCRRYMRIEDWTRLEAVRNLPWVRAA